MMNKVIISINRNSEVSKKLANNVAKKLMEKKRQVSIESQQLSTVGMMPDPKYEVIDVAKLSVADAIHLIKEANKEIKKSHYVIVKSNELETVQERIDRETLTEALKDEGADVLESESDVVDSISNLYNSLGMEIKGGEQNV